MAFKRNACWTKSCRRYLRSSLSYSSAASCSPRCLAIASLIHCFSRSPDSQGGDRDDSQRALQEIRAERCGEEDRSQGSHQSSRCRRQTSQGHPAMRRLKNPNQWPPGGWNFEEPSTGFRFRGSLLHCFTASSAMLPPSSLASLTPRVIFRPSRSPMPTNTQTAPLDNTTCLRDKSTNPKSGS